MIVNRLLDGQVIESIDVRKHMEAWTLKAMWTWPREAWEAIEREAPWADPEDIYAPALRRVFELLANAWRTRREKPTTGELSAAMRTKSDEAHMLMLMDAADVNPLDCGYEFRTLRRSRIEDLKKSRAVDVAAGHVKWEDGFQEIKALEAELDSSVGESRGGKVAAQVMSDICDTRSPEEKGHLLWNVRAWDRTGSHLYPGCYAVMAAYPGVGKTTFALQWSYWTAVRTKRSILYVILEDGRPQGTRKVLHNISGTPWKEDRSYTSEELAELAKAQEHMDTLGASWHIVDDMPSEASALCRAMAAHVRAHDHKAVVVDYLGLAPGKGRSEYERVTQATRQFQTFARETGVILLACHQFSRQDKSQKPRVPRMSDLRGSGQIEQDATHILLGYRPSECFPTMGHDADDVVWLMSKSKHGRRGVSQAFTLDGARSRITQRA